MLQLTCTVSIANRNTCFNYKYVNNHPHRCVSNNTIISPPHVHAIWRNCWEMCVSLSHLPCTVVSKKSHIHGHKHTITWKHDKRFSASNSDIARPCCHNYFYSHVQLFVWTMFTFTAVISVILSHTHIQTHINTHLIVWTHIYQEHTTHAGWIQLSAMCEQVNTFLFTGFEAHAKKKSVVIP